MIGELGRRFLGFRCGAVLYLFANLRGGVALREEMGFWVWGFVGIGGEMGWVVLSVRVDIW